MRPTYLRRSTFAFEFIHVEELLALFLRKSFPCSNPQTVFLFIFNSSENARMLVRWLCDQHAQTIGIRDGTSGYGSSFTRNIFDRFSPLLKQLCLFKYACLRDAFVLHTPPAIFGEFSRIFRQISVEIESEHVACYSNHSFLQKYLLKHMHNTQTKICC